MRWSLAAFAITLAAALATVCIWFRNPIPRLSRAGFDSALQRWEHANISDYDIEVEVQGRQAAVYRVAVRNNKVQSALRNGYPLKQRRTQGTWSVPGMFGTIEIDLENVEAAAQSRIGDSAEDGAAKNAASRLLLRATFDPRFGYPSYYHRGQLGGEDVVWRVRRFVVTGRRVSTARWNGPLPCSSVLPIAACSQAVRHSPPLAANAGT